MAPHDPTKITLLIQFFLCYMDMEDCGTKVVTRKFIDKCAQLLLKVS